MAELLSLLSSIFSSLPSWTGAFIAGLALVGTIVYNAVNVHNLTIQIRGARQEEARREQEVAATLERLQTETKRLENDTQRLQTQQVALLVQQRRLAEHNLRVDTSVKFLHRDAAHRGADAQTPASVAEGFVVMSLNLVNVGDSPVDLLACLVAGRELSNARGTTMGAAGRDVRWEELPHYYWNEGYSLGAAAEQTRGGLMSSAPDAHDGIFKGLSTTRNLPYSRYQLIRLDPGEREVLNRIDYVTNLEDLYDRGHVNLVYKVFTITLGYPLTDLTGRLRDEGASEVDTSSVVQALRARELARPNFHRWARIQRALFLVNRFTFRLALEGRELEEDGELGKYHSEDPLGRLSEPTAFRCFLLHHWDFSDSGTAAPEGAPDPIGDLRREAGRAGSAFVSTDEAREYIAEHFAIRDPKSNTPENYAKAQTYCRDNLRPFTDVWVRLNEAIHRCYRPNFGFEDLIQEPEYQARWEALKREGYVLTRYPETSPEPVETTAIERFNMRTKYVLVTVSTPRPRIAEHERESVAARPYAQGD